MPRTMFVIPARGGSKRLPRKNMRVLGGLPLIGRTTRLAVACLRELGGDGRVVVSTDDVEIADAARRQGGEVPYMRPAELSDDGASSRAVVLHLLDWLREKLGPEASERGHGEPARAKHSHPRLGRREQLPPPPPCRCQRPLRMGGRPRALLHRRTADPALRVTSQKSV